MFITIVSMKIILDLYGGIADSHQAHPRFCVGDDVFLQADAGFPYT
jgi:hypothetical protein